jgi:hypothetical protein
VTILPTKMWEQFRRITKFDRHDIVAAHCITKRDADILYMGLRKIHYNVMRFKDTMTADEADALAGRAKTVAAQHYVLHDLFRKMYLCQIVSLCSFQSYPLEAWHSDLYFDFLAFQIIRI